MARLSAACSKATLSGERLRDVMSQPSATSCIHAPKSEANPAIHNARKTGSRSGAHAEGRGAAAAAMRLELTSTGRPFAASLRMWFNSLPMKSRLWPIAFTLFATSCGGANASVPTSTAATPTPPAAASSLSTTPSALASASPPPAQAAGAPLSAADARALLAAADRTDADRNVDKVRHPDQLLVFMGAGPGMRVADLGAAGGYTTELLVRAVGSSGKVYSQNDPDYAKRFKDRIDERLARPINKDVVRVYRTFDDPLPPEARDLDLVVLYIFYHDVVWFGADRDKMNKALFAALKPGGAYVVVDASAKAGDGTSNTKTLHRIEETVVKSEVEKAGFVLAGSADFLRNPDDTRDWNSSPRAAGDRLGTEDRFVLKFVKPR